MNKEIRFYFADEDGNKGDFLSFVRINDLDDKPGSFQVWSGPVDDEQSQICLSIEPATAEKILTTALELLKED